MHPETRSTKDDFPTKSNRNSSAEKLSLFNDDEATVDKTNGMSDSNECHCNMNVPAAPPLPLHPLMIPLPPPLVISPPLFPHLMMPPPLNVSHHPPALNR